MMYTCSQERNRDHTGLLKEGRQEPGEKKKKRDEYIFNNYSSSPNSIAIDSEAVRARGIIVLVKSN